MFGLIPKDEKFFAMFREMTRNIIEGAELLKDMMDNFEDPAGSQRRAQSRAVPDVGLVVTGQRVSQMCGFEVAGLGRRSERVAGHACSELGKPKRKP